VKNPRTWIIIGAVAIAAYLLYRWWQNKQSATNSPTGSLGTNLNSVAPELIGGSSGPESGLTYNQGTTQVDLTLPGGPAIDQQVSSVTPGTDNGPVFTGVGTPKVFPARQP